MSTLINVTRNDDGQFELTDQSGNLVAGPFETNAAAWKAIDRLGNDNVNRPDKARSSKKVLWGKPEQLSKTKSKKALKRQEKQMKTNAAKAPGWLRTVAAKTFDPAGERKYRDYRLGTFGAASEVKRIDPATYLAEKAAKGE
ncbi:hypothetical protein AB3480_06590 [Rhizobium mongolense]|uniref:hypothetical protein n=1 Tax=Rhizobium mongolense TaxID=57676 RepID=UPI0034A42CEC